MMEAFSAQLLTLDRKKLQSLARAAGLQANSRSALIIEQLQILADREKIEDASKDAVSRSCQSTVKSVEEGKPMKTRSFIPDFRY